MTNLSAARVEVLADPEALARRAADWLLAAAAGKEGIFSVCLSGGSTPRRLYERLAASPYLEAFPWSRTHWFWGDERFVPHAHHESNYRMAREALLSRAPIPEANIHAIPTDGIGPDEAAAAYERALKAFYGSAILKAERPLFDVTFLGLGPDGHIGSLFPGTAILDERVRWVGTVVRAEPNSRITLTYPALESSRATAFLATGEGKRAVLERLFRRDRELPAARLRPVGSLRFFLDRAAAPENRP
jgi:6-phosphogluconolactonase